MAGLRTAADERRQTAGSQRGAAATMSRPLRLDLFLCGSLLLGLAGCAGSPDEENVTWSCVRTADGSNWDCAQQRVRGGVPVGPATVPHAAVPPAAVPAPAVAVTASSAAGGQPASETRVRAHPVTPPVAKVARSQGLPGLQEVAAGVEALPVVAAPTLRAEPSAAPPEPEPAMARWEGQSQPARTSAAPGLGSQPATPAVTPPQSRDMAEPRNVAEPWEAQAKSPGKAPVTGERSGDGVEAGGPAEGYTVQLGAFDSVDRARAFIVRQDLAGLPVELDAVARGGKQYQTVVFGTFRSVREAEAAWQAAAEGRELEHWVRRRGK